MKPEIEYVKGYGNLSFPKNIDKNLSNKYSQKLFDNAKTSGATKVAADAIKTDSKRVIQKTAEAKNDLIGNKTADKITNVSKKYSQINLDDAKYKEQILKSRYISP